MAEISFAKDPPLGNATEILPLVEGRLVPPASDETVDVVSPSTGMSLFCIPAGSEVDANNAVASSRRAFEDGRWSESAPSFRKGVLHRFAELIASEASALDRLDAQEMGKPVSTSFCSAAAASGLAHFFAEAIDKVMGDVFASDRTTFVTQRRVPRGVVAAVVPWNFPTFNAILKVSPALAAGNCVILKPSELSTRSAMRLAQMALEAGLPPGVLNVVPGLGRTVGRALGLHCDVDMIAFTGSTKVGKLMLQYSGESNMKSVQLECGGKSPQIVFADGVDLHAASEAIAGFLLTNQGQICSVGSRLLIHRSIEDAVVQRIKSHFADVKMGDPLDPKVTFGPLVTEAQLSRVKRYIDNAISVGGKLLAGGKRTLTHTGGAYIEPTIICNVRPDSQIAQDEVFGPVLSVIPFEDEEEAVRIANSTSYGLSAYVWTSKLSTAMRVGKSIRSEVIINAVPPTGEGAGHSMSSEPTRQSGIGVEGGLGGLETYMRRQLLWFNH